MKNVQPTICIAGHRFIRQKQGGVELQTWYIGEALAAAGWAVAYLCPDLKHQTHHENIRENIDVWWFPHFSFVFQTPKRLIERMLDAIQPTLFYQRGRGILTANNLILKYARKKSIPHIFALSSDKDLDAFYEVKAMLNSEKPVWKKFLLTPYALLLDKAMRNILKKTDYLVCQHNDQNKSISKKLHRESYILRTIHKENNEQIIKSPKNLILWVCNYRPLKQAGLFIQLADHCKDINCHFIMIYGNTKKQYIDPVLKQASGKNNLTIYGQLEQSKIEELIRKAILFINTSKYEGFPNTFIQAWLRETPTLSLNVDPGGVIIRERIGMRSGSFKQLVKDVKYLVEHKHERTGMGKRARKYAEKTHGFRRNAGILTDFFNSIIDNKMSP